MKFPKLPTPESVDGRLLYTAGQMREYGRECAEAFMGEVDASRVSHNASGQGGYGAAFDDLFQKMGMKK